MQLPRGNNGIWISNPVHTSHALDLGDECTFFGCYWYEFEGEWIFQNGTVIRTPEQVIAMPLMPTTCIIGECVCVCSEVLGLLGVCVVCVCVCVHVHVCTCTCREQASKYSLQCKQEVASFPKG